MNSSRFARLQELFARGRELPREQRDEFLREACGDDDELLAEVHDLLAEDSQWSGDAVDRALGGDDELGRSASRPEWIGKYRVLGICGSGGMGTVFEAVQTSPHRRVALKVIQAMAPRPELLLRFQREADILARLQHPCIAQVFEAGEFEHEGVTRPFYAMEFVDGQPLLEFATSRALDVRARLDLFEQICEAIDYAHRQGVVHRDLKPDNIFVVEKSGSSTASRPNMWQPKVLDFGVARLADPEDQLTVATDAGQLLGSVPYMSPEQATGNTDQVDVRSDVYSLGVVLFELLAGQLPYAVRRRPLADALHAIRYDEPKRLGSADPGLRGDLETIAGKCLEKDPERRYDSVATLLEDLGRYRALQPITARPPTTWYQLVKFTQRHRAAVSAFSVTLIVIILSTILAVNYASAAVQCHQVALRSQAQVDACSCSVITGGLLIDDDPATPITNLDGLSGLASISGALVIQDNPKLRSLDGLRRLASVTHSVLVRSNASLSSVSGLSALALIGGELNIQQNPALADVGGLDKLTSVGSHLRIDDNARLANVTGLTALSAIRGDASIRRNRSLLDIAGMSSLESIGAGLHIDDNDALQRVTGLTALREVRGPVHFQYLDAITDLDVLNHLESVGGTLLIQKNPNLTRVTGFRSLRTTGAFTIQYNPRLTGMPGTRDMTHTVRGVLILDNAVLTHLDFLAGLRSVGHDLKVLGNPRLTRWAGLHRLFAAKGLGRTTQIRGNARNPSPADILAAGPLEPAK